jgi:hypothetical protein
MSGGSLDYIFSRVEDASEMIRKNCDTPLHKAFARHLLLVSKALHDIEWVMSGDKGEGDDIEAIKKVVSSQLLLETLVEDAKEIQKQLKEALSSIEGKNE